MSGYLTYLDAAKLILGPLLEDDRFAHRACLASHDAPLIADPTEERFT